QIATLSLHDALPICRVDRFDGADAFIECVDRLIDHRQQDAIDHEGGEVLGDRIDFSELVYKILGELEGLVAGGDATYQFDEFHADRKSTRLNSSHVK